MTDTGRTIFGSGSPATGAMLDDQSESAELEASNGTITFSSPDFTDLGDWPDQETNISLSGTPSFGAWDDFSEGASYEFGFTESAVYNIQGRVNWTGPGTGLDRRCRFKVSNTECSAWGFDAYNGTVVRDLMFCAEGSAVTFEFTSANASDVAASVTLSIYRVIRG